MRFVEGVAPANLARSQIVVPFMPETHCQSCLEVGMPYEHRQSALNPHALKKISTATTARVACPAAYFTGWPCVSDGVSGGSNELRPQQTKEMRSQARARHGFAG